MVKKRIGIIGATGSVGSAGVEVVHANQDIFETIFVTAHSNEKGLENAKNKLQAKYALLTSKIEDNKDIIDIINNENVDIVLFAAAGVSCVKLVYDIVHNGTNIALANKESIVTAGRLIIDEAKSKGVKILPVDSEHSAIFQCLMGQRRQYVSKITLTASGGPFRYRPGDAFEYVNINEALKHPNWLMGSKITIDSATMMNKGLELIEARFLFDIEPCKLDVIIHPESIVHSYITFIDGSTIAQLGLPNMKTPIAFALGYPERIISQVEPINLFEQKSLTFLKPDLEKFRCLKIAKEVLEKDSNDLMAAMNAANEEAVKAVLKGKIAFKDISYVIEDVISKADVKDAQNILEAEENIKKYQIFASEFLAKY